MHSLLPNERRSRSLAFSTALSQKLSLRCRCGHDSLISATSSFRERRKRPKHCTPSTRQRSTNGGPLSRRRASRQNDFVVPCWSRTLVTRSTHEEGLNAQAR